MFVWYHSWRHLECVGGWVTAVNTAAATAATAKAAAVVAKATAQLIEVYDGYDNLVYRTYE